MPKKEWPDVVDNIFSNFCLLVVIVGLLVLAYTGKCP